MRSVITLSLFLFLSLTVLCSCATTAYQPYEAGIGGYKDSQLDNNTFRVSFGGNGRTSEETVFNYLMYRCAELTLKNDCDFFVLIDVSSKVHRRSSTNRPGLTIHMGVAYTEVAVIKIFHGEKPQNIPAAFDAKELKTSLEPKIKRRKPRLREEDEDEDAPFQ